MQINKTIIKIEPFLNGINIGKAISANGSLQIMEILNDSPKFHSELFEASQIPSSTFNNSLKGLVENKIIINNKLFYTGKKNSQYTLSQNGKGLLKIIKKFERELSLDKSQQKLMEK